MQVSPSKKKYTPKQKEQLLANLDLEIADQTRKMEGMLADALQSFMTYQEGVVSRIPRMVRDITMAEFAKYNGNVQACVTGLREQFLRSDDSGLDKAARKRKWLQDTSEKLDAKAGTSAAGTRDAETTKGSKSARTIAATPKKKVGPPAGPSTAQRARFTITKTPSTNRTIQRVPSGAASPSPHKPLAQKPLLFPRTPSRVASTSKLPSPVRSTHPNGATSKPIRPPSSASFNPVLPGAQPRWPRNDESMLSVNGSPLANPYQFGLNGWLRSVAEDGMEQDTDVSENELEPRGKGASGARRKNGIIVRSSSSSHTAVSHGLHSRTNSQTSLLAGHSRSDSQTNGSATNAMNGKNHASDLTPKAPLLSLAALVSVPTQDGHVLEFDPLRTSPDELDALEGISDAAKQRAKEDMAQLIQAAVERWKIG